MLIQESDYNRFDSVTMVYQTQNLKIYLTAKKDNLDPDKYNTEVAIEWELGSTSFYQTLFTTQYAYDTIREALDKWEERIDNNFDLESYKWK